LPFSKSYVVLFTLFHVFQFSCHILSPTVCFKHFPNFSVFFPIFHILQNVYLIFHDFQFSRHILGPSLYISHFPRFPVFLVIFQVLQCAILIFPLFSVFLAIF
jgi:hypothetical protein